MFVFYVCKKPKLPWDIRADLNWIGQIYKIENGESNMAAEVYEN